jgi:hypothetical protein
MLDEMLLQKKEEMCAGAAVDPGMVKSENS